MGHVFILSNYRPEFEEGPYRSMTPIWVSENGNLCAVNGFGNLMSPETGAHCFDKGPFRGG